MTRRILLTGASGFLGRHAISALLDRGFEVHAATRRAPCIPGIIPHTLDLFDQVATVALMQHLRPSHLLHLAWDVTPGRYWQAPENLDWVAASLHLYRAFAAAGGRRATIAGTCAEYDWTGDQLDEGAPLRPSTLYGIAKHALHQLLTAAALNDGIDLAWARVFFLYGPHEAPARLVPSVVIPLLQGKLALMGDGLAQRDFMHVQDVATALVTVLDSQHRGAVNIATGQCTPIRDVVMAVAAQIGQQDLVRLGARPTSPEEPLLLAASGHVLAQLGFRPRFSLQTGLADAIDWWRNQLASKQTQHQNAACLSGNQKQLTIR